jgi:hypothetical protein
LWNVSFEGLKGDGIMSDTNQTETRRDPSANAKLPWQTPALEVLPAAQTRNNGLIAPGDGTFSPSPTGS